MIKIKLADLRIGVEENSPRFAELVNGYITQEEETDFIVSASEEDIAFEQTQNERRALRDDDVMRQWRHAYLEKLAIYRKIAERLPGYGAFLFHGSAVAVDGEAYLFTARSGTGKSTHTRLWREHFGSRCVMINDDKPLLRLQSDGRFFVYGTPWDGKHHLSSNVCVQLKAVCILTRDEYNHIEPLKPEEAYSELLMQTFRPSDGNALMQTMELLDTLTRRAGLYRLGCTMDPEAAVISYEGMQKKMKLKEGFRTHMAGDKQVMAGVASTGFSGLVRSNATAAFIIDQLKQETTEEQIVQAVLARYEDAPEAQVRADVQKVIGTLRGINALDE